MQCEASLWLINHIIFVFLHEGKTRNWRHNYKDRALGTRHKAQDTVPGDQRKIKFSAYFRARKRRRRIRLFVSNTQGAAEYSSQLKKENKQKTRRLSIKKDRPEQMIYSLVL